MVKVKIVDGKTTILEKGSKDPESHYFDGILSRNLDEIKEIIKQDWDFVWLIDGIEGCGKSVFAQQLAWYCTGGKLGIDDICFTSEEFKKRVKEQKPYHAVIFDEAFRGLSGRSRLSTVNREIVEILLECRQRNLFIFIVLPSVWELDTYAKLHRSKGLFHVFTDEGWRRGFWKFYRNKEKGGLCYFKRFFTEPKNRYSYPKFATLKGCFTKKTPVEDQLYRKKKSASFGKKTYVKDKAQAKRDALWKERCSILVNLLNKRKEPMTQREISIHLGLERGTVSDLKRCTAAGGSISLGDKNEETKTIEKDL